MSKPFNAPHGRMLILITVFILLAGMIVLIYTHPDKKRSNADEKATYEQHIRDIWHEQITQLLAQGDLTNARLAAGKVLHSIPDDIFAKRILVRIAAEEKKIALATRMCRDIILHHPEDAASRNNLAVLLMPQNAVEAAREIAIALQLAPDNPVIKRNFEIIDRSVKKQELTGIQPDNGQFPDLLSLKIQDTRS